MELGFVEGLRRRWDVLGIELDVKQKGKERATESDERLAQMRADAEEDDDDGESARKEIMRGAIIKSVISNAVTASPKPELFVSLQKLVSTYPCPAQLRDSLLEHIYELLKHTLPHDPQAIRLAAARFLPSDLKGPGLVDALKHANETFASALREMLVNGVQADDMSNVYAEFVEEWCSKGIDHNLVIYLVSSLHSLVQLSIKAGHPSAGLSTAHLTLLTRLHGTLSSPSLSSSPEKVLKLARKYTGLQNPTCTSSRLWLARLDAEKTFLPQDRREIDLVKTWKDARTNASGEGVVGVWMWGLDQVDDTDRKQKLLGDLLNESMRMQDSSSWRDVHEGLLVRYVTLAIASSTAQSTNIAQLLSIIQHIKQDFLPDRKVWEISFSLLSSSSSPAATVLKQVFAYWSSLDVSSAGLAYATWLMNSGDSKESVRVIRGCIAKLDGNDKADMERKWMKVVNGQGEEQEEQSSETITGVHSDV